MDDKRDAGGTTEGTGYLFGDKGQETPNWHQEAEKIRPVLEPFLGKGWFDALKMEFVKKYMVNLSKVIRQKRELRVIYPSSENVFLAFKETPLEDTKVFIAGQDPYHNGAATGLAFANNTADSTLINCSLKKITEYVGFMYDLGYLDFPPITDYTLSRWSSQGVLLLNRVLTVEAGKPRSHASAGWELFTNEVVRVLNRRPQRMVFMLWGKDARDLRELIDHRKHLILTCEHPAAACYDNRMWKGDECFGKANEFLENVGRKKILW